MISKFNLENNINKYYIKSTVRNVDSSSFHGHDFFELEICLSGSGNTVINNNKYSVYRGSVFLITPADIHNYIDGRNLKILNLTFTPDAIEYSSFIELLYPMKYVAGHVDDATLNIFEMYINKMFSESNEIAGQKKQFTKKYISLLLSCILIELYRINTNDSEILEEKIPPSLHIQKAIYFIRSHFKENITQKDVADNCDISISTLNRKLTEYLGMGFKKYLVNLRLEYARQLILQTEEQITNIALFSGFNSLSYFQRAFTKKFNMTPTAYRKKRKKGNKA